jgi:hypothetical protein
MCLKITQTYHVPVEIQQKMALNGDVTRKLLQPVQELKTIASHLP